MIYISHRGNLNGPNRNKENSPDYLNEALASGFAIEADIWWEEGAFFFGHDRPQYQYQSDSFDLCDERVYCHAKNLAALEHLCFIGAHCFFHDLDEYTVTNRGYIWTNIDSDVLSEQGPSLRTFSVLPEIRQVPNNILKQCLGICSDYIARYQMRLG